MGLLTQQAKKAGICSRELRYGPGHHVQGRDELTDAPMRLSEHRRLHLRYRTTLTAAEGYGFSRLAPKPSSVTHTQLQQVADCQPVYNVRRLDDGSGPWEVGENRSAALC